MKRLIVTIIVAILTMSLSGCSFVKEYYRGRPHHEVIVTTPRHLPPRPVHRPRPYAHRHYERNRHHGSWRRHR